MSAWRSTTMISIKSLALNNFQSHTSSLLELAELTAFVGPSSSGKSSTERGMLWLFFGDWDAAYPADNSIPTTVAVTLSDGTQISRSRLGDKQTAKITVPGEPDRDFKDFGSEIPGVFDLINLRPIIAGKEKVYLNFAHQEPKRPFLVGDTKPAKAQLIGRLYGAHVVNAMLRLLNKDKLELGRSVKEKDADLQAVAVQRAGYNGLDAREAAVKAARAAYDEAAALETLQAKVAGLRAEAAALRDRRWLVGYDFATLRAALGSLDALAAIRTQAAAYTGCIRDMQPRRWLLGRSPAAAGELVAELANLESAKTRLSAIATELARLSSTPRWLFDATGLRIKLAEHAELERLNVALMAQIRAVKSTEEANSLNKSRYADAQERLKAASGECPLCHQSVDAATALELAAQLVKA